jgi:hypothetical protein
MKRRIISFAVAIAIAATACGYPAPARNKTDAPEATPDSPVGAHACVLDTDTFDHGCTLST